MSDEEGLVRPAEAPDRRYGETLLYDFAKFLTTLSLIAMGGVLTLNEAAKPGEIRVQNLALVVIAIGSAGVLALSTANDLVKARAAGREPSRRLSGMLQWAMGLLGIAGGAFLAMYLDTLA